MASFKAGKLEIFKNNKLLFILIICLVICIWLMGMISELLSVSSKDLLSPVQNFKLREENIQDHSNSLFISPFDLDIWGGDGKAWLVDPLASMLKQGEELFIKDSTGQIKRIKEIKIEDGFKIPQAIIDQINKLESIKLEQLANPNFKCPVDVQEMNKNLVEHIEHLHRQVKMQTQENVEKINSINSVENKNIELETIQRYCEDSDIEDLIFDSIFDEATNNQLKQSNCNLGKTELYHTREIKISNSKTKYLFIYICIVFPLFMIYYLQNKKYKCIKNDLNNSSNLCSPNSSSWKSEKLSNEANFTKWGSKINWNFITYFWKKMIGIGDYSQPNFNLNNSRIDFYNYLQNIDNCHLSPTYYTLTRFNRLLDAEHHEENHFETETVDNSIYSFDIITTNNGVKKDHPKIDGIEMPCKYCNDYNEYHCPNHYHLYSTDEASSSEAEFICLSTMKSGKGKNKKKVKEVKKTQQCMLSNFAKLFTQ